MTTPILIDTDATVRTLCRRCMGKKSITLFGERDIVTFTCQKCHGTGYIEGHYSDPINMFVVLIDHKITYHETLGKLLLSLRDHFGKDGQWKDCLGDKVTIHTIQMSRDEYNELQVQP